MEHRKLITAREAGDSTYVEINYYHPLRGFDSIFATFPRAYAAWLYAGTRYAGERHSLTKIIDDARNIGLTHKFNICYISAVVFLDSSGASGLLVSSLWVSWGVLVKADCLHPGEPAILAVTKGDRLLSRFHGGLGAWQFTHKLSSQKWPQKQDTHAIYRIFKR